MQPNDRPPISGEPPQPQVHDETCTHPEEQRRTQVIEEPTIYEVCSACEHVMAIRTLPASTGAALDVLRDLFVAMQAEPVVHGTDRFHHDRWMRWSRDTFMPAWNAAAECIARLAEQKGDR